MVVVHGHCHLVINIKKNIIENILISSLLLVNYGSAHVMVLIFDQSETIKYSTNQRPLSIRPIREQYIFNQSESSKYSTNQRAVNI